MLTCMTYTDEERRRIGEAVRRARIRAGLDKEPAARAAQVNSITWKRVEDAEKVRDASLGTILASLRLPAADEITATEGEQTDLSRLSDDDLLGELCRRLAMRHDKPKHPIPLDFSRRPLSARQNPGVGGDEDGDERHQVGG